MVPAPLEKYCTGTLKDTCGQRCEFTSFAFCHCDMAVEILALHSFDHETQPVTACVKIGTVDLVRVSGKYDLRIFACPADNRLDFMGSKVLGLVNNHILLWDRPSPDICQGLNLNCLAAPGLYQA